MADDFDGLLTFFASHHAIRAEKTLSDASMAVRLIPGPKDLSPNCGVALRFMYAEREAAMELLAASHVTIDEVRPYRPATDDWQRPSTRRRQFRRRGAS